MVNLLGLYLMDRTAIFVTSFDLYVFLYVYLFHSFILAADALINEYFKKVGRHTHDGC